MVDMSRVQPSSRVHNRYSPARGLAHVEVLGHIAVRSANGHTAIAGRPALILGALAVERGPISAIRLINLLWDRPPTHEYNALQRHVSRLRSILGRHGAGGAIDYQAGAYVLDRTLVTVDIDYVDNELGWPTTSEASISDPPYLIRWWLEPLAPIDHIDMAGVKWSLQQRCDLIRQQRQPTATKSAFNPAGDVPAEVIDQLDRWLDLRSAHDEAAEVIRRWLAAVRPDASQFCGVG